ncbi:hypothetical protein [Caulobacter sp. SSI4214]|uniref:hypothetical protein n=1 Tax=Caulobacter sp. SSI4214 TaxID=2575739 RepID=UPI00143A9E3C|nr:hypothetical protein [Caulobacter sp. SSI4214]
MLLSALALAAALESEPLAAPHHKRPADPPATTLVGAKEHKALMTRLDHLARCGEYGVQQAQGATAERAPRTERLGDLPPAHGEWAVARMVDGCPVATPIAMRPGKIER